MEQEEELREGVRRRRLLWSWIKKWIYEYV